LSAKIWLCKINHKDKGNKKAIVRIYNYKKLDTVTAQINLYCYYFAKY